MKFPNFIRHYRELAGLQPVDVYTPLGWSQSRYSHYESGDRKLQFEDAQLIADVIGCATDSLFTGKEGPEALRKNARYKALQNALIRNIFSGTNEEAQKSYIDLLDKQIDELSHDESGQHLLGYLKGIRSTLKD